MFLTKATAIAISGLIGFLRSTSQQIFKVAHLLRCRFHYCGLLSKNLATLEENGMGPAKQERAESEAAQQKNAMLTAQLVWAAYAWNVTPEEAAKQIVTDLYEHLSRGGSVQVNVADSHGSTLEVTATRR